MKEIQQLLGNVSSLPASKEELRLALSLIDLTSLEGKDNEKTIEFLCEKAKKFKTPAVCVYPSLISIAKNQLKGTPIKVASVAGAFPSGQLPLQLRLDEAKYALDEGADEIDMVISRGKFLQGDYHAVSEEVSAFKKICVSKTLKVILETGELETIQNISLASKISIEAGADFIKTSTGKITINATLEHVCTMLLAIKVSGKQIGIKPSGGLSDTDTTVKYMRLTEMILGKEWLNSNLFRFGASRMADFIAEKIAVNNSTP